RGSTRAHIVRAALESIAFQSAELATAMARDAGMALTDLRVDGGASVNNFLMQFQSDLLQIPVTRPTVTETTALGAAYLAGLAVGFWKSTAEISALWEKDRTFTPAMAPAEASARMGEWQRAVRRALT
ncbi:MAG: glycerol kinase, partial [Betaproteobacteria bacterium]|nr:glycerol kinase [Betaproteobacteria bacterium]